MTARTGTTFTFRLLALHPDVEAASRLHEDYVVQHAHLLVEYARRTRQRWNPGWPIRPGAEARLIGRLGRGLYAFLTEEALDRATPGPRRPLFKTPSVQSVQHFLTSSPTPPCWSSCATAATSWNPACARSGGPTRSRPAGGAVRPEPCWTSRPGIGATRAIAWCATRISWPIPRERCGRCWPFCDWTPCATTFRPRGTCRSTARPRSGGERAEVHWEPVPKTEAFRPVGRWEGWSPYRRRRFAWAAGDLMRMLGYEIEGRLAGWERAQNRLVDRGAWLMAVGRRASGIVSRLLRPRASDLSRPACMRR